MKMAACPKCQSTEDPSEVVGSNDASVAVKCPACGLLTQWVLCPPGADHQRKAKGIARMLWNSPDWRALGWKNECEFLVGPYLPQEENQEQSAKVVFELKTPILLCIGERTADGKWRSDRNDEVLGSGQVARWWAFRFY